MAFGEAPGPIRKRVRQGPITLFGMPPVALVLLALTAAMAVCWSNAKLIHQDEMFVLQTDSVSSLSQLVHIQHDTPISLDPMVFHAMVHASMRLFGVNSLALRLPSLLGFLLMQVCLFYLMGRLLEDSRLACRAGVVALALPALAATLYYAAEGRPYGLLLGFYALALLHWKIATVEKGHRTLSLCTLGLAVGLTLNTHYFGILLLIPLCAAEVVRSIQRRRIDPPMLAAIAFGTACFVFVLPFQRAAGEFRKHYYNAGRVALRGIAQTYRTLLVDYTHFSRSTQHLLAACIAGLGILFAFAVITRLRTPSTRLPLADTVFLLLLTALPFFGFLLAVFVTHSLEVRFVVGAIVGIAALAAWAAAPTLRSTTTYRIVCGVLLLGIAANGAFSIHQQTLIADHQRESLRFPDAVKQAVMQDPSRLLYFQDIGAFELASFYEPDPAFRSRLALMYSRDRELAIDQHDTISLTAMHMRAFTPFPIMSYDEVARRPGAHTFIVYKSGWDWAAEAFVQDHATITPLGSAYDGQVLTVRFPAR